MATLTYFTAKLYLQAVTGDEPDDVDTDTDPQIKGIHGGVTITPQLHGATKPTGIYLRATTLTPNPALVVLAPTRARIDAGRLKMFADNEGDPADQPDVRLVAQTAVLALPAGVELRYTFEFDHVTYNGGPQQLPAITIAAPTTDTTVDLASATWISD